VTSVAARALQIISDPAFLEDVRNKGDYFRDCLRELGTKHEIIKEIKGRGLMTGAELSIPGQRIVERCLRKGAIINCTHETVLRFVPPLVVTRAEIDRLVSILDAALAEEYA
jgi:acetylornithine/N-succinyldiaminopimelate aminotransferase